MRSEKRSRDSSPVIELWQTHGVVVVIVTIADWGNLTTVCTRSGWVSMSTGAWQNM